MGENEKRHWKKKKQVARKLHHNLKNKEDITKKQVKRRQC